MINLLFDEEKKAIARAYRGRRFLVCVLACSAALLAGIVLLFPALNSLDIERDTTEEMLGARAEIPQVSVQTQVAVREAHEVLEAVENVVATSTDPVAAIRAVLLLKPAGVKLSGFAYDRKEDGVTLRIRGQALDRETLQRFAELLRHSPQFSKVELPPSAFVARAEIAFTIVLTYN